MRSVVVISLLIAALSGGAVADWRSIISHEVAVQTMRPDVVTVKKVARKDCPLCKGTGKLKAGDTRTIVWRECDNCEPPASGDVAKSEGPKVELPRPLEVPPPKDIPSVESQPRPSPPVEEPADFPPSVERPDPLRDKAAVPDDAARPAVRDKRVLVFTASWCGPCISILKPNLAAMKARGWTVGPEPTNQFQIVDDVPTNSDLVRIYAIKAWPSLILVDGDGTEVKRQEGAITTFQMGDLYNTQIPPGGMFNMKLGTVKREQIDNFRKALSLLGKDGWFEAHPNVLTAAIFPLSDTSSIEVKLPLKVRYTMEGETIKLLFDTPPPVRWRFLKGGLTAVEITVDRVNIHLAGLPDQFFEVVP